MSMAMSSAFYTLLSCMIMYSLVPTEIKYNRIYVTCEHSNPYEIKTKGSIDVSYDQQQPERITSVTLKRNSINAVSIPSQRPQDQKTISAAHEILHQKGRNGCVDNATTDALLSSPAQAVSTTRVLFDLSSVQQRNKQYLASNSQVVYDQHTDDVSYRSRTGTPTDGSVIGPNSTGETSLGKESSHYPRRNQLFNSPQKHILNISGSPHGCEYWCKKYGYHKFIYLALYDSFTVDIKVRYNTCFVVHDCPMVFKAPNATSISVILLELSCDWQDRVVVTDPDNRWMIWQSCVRHINPGVDWTSDSRMVFIYVEPYGEKVFTVRLNAMAVSKSEPGTIQTRYISQTLGYIQNKELQLYFGKSSTLPSVYGTFNTWSYLAVPGRNVVLTSVVIAGLGSMPPAKACQHRIELYEGSLNKTVWRLCSRYHSLPQPHVSYKEDVLVHFVFDGNEYELMQGIGFRLMFTFHDIFSVPMQLSSGKWNCSVPEYLVFHHHFKCDLIIHCAGSEDEEICPLYTQCGHNGILRDGKCYSLIRLDTGTTWHQANAMCSRLGLGGRLTSQFSFAQATTINNILRIDLTVYSGNVVLTGISSVATDNHLLEYVLPGQVHALRTMLCTTCSEQIVLECGNNGIVNSGTWRHLLKKCTKYVCYGSCETNIHTKNDNSGQVKPVYQIVLPNTTCSEPCPVPFPHIVCDQGHVTHAFLAFDQQTHCFHKPTSLSCYSVLGWTCDGFVTQLLVPFACGSRAQHVNYTLVCDHRQDCHDNSDEDFCFFPPCDLNVHIPCETNQECQPLATKCNFQPDCLDGSDETDCVTVQLKPARFVQTSFIVDLEGHGGYPIITKVNDTAYPYCPHTHYRCPSDGNCLPVFTRCNGVSDCSAREDEQECESYVCPGLYRCRGHDLCVLPNDLCDGVLHCPQHDDERFCNLTCPDHCTCLGYAFVCRRPLYGHRFRQLRYLDGQDSEMKLEGLVDNAMLIYLNLARCNIIHLSNVTLPNLKILDLSDNKLSIIGLSDLKRFKNLHALKLSGNPIIALFVTSVSDDVRPIDKLQAMDLSRVKLNTLDLSLFAPFPNLQLLNLSKSDVNVVQKTMHQSSLPKTLRQLDARGCALKEFPRTLFQGVDNLQFVFSDTFKMCCPAVLPNGFVAENCHAPFNELSSCEDLLHSNFYRVGLSVLATFGLLGNSVSFIVRLCRKKSNSRSGFGVFVQNLCMSDFLMGIYLVFIGVADRLFMSNYLWEDLTWRHSVPCRLAGFISMMSCEVSSFVIFLVTVDRFLVLRFPFSQFRFDVMSAQIASVVTWVVGGALAAIPLLPVAQTWEFYSQTGICIPLPVTQKEFAGQDYAFGVMIVLNFIVFILIAGGQVSIYASIQAGKMSEGETGSKSRDSVIARRLIFVVVSDFLCWFPIGLLGLLASNGTPIPGTINVAMAIFILPVNSALNPFVYTLNMLQERFQKKKEDKMLKILMQETLI